MDITLKLLPNTITMDDRTSVISQIWQLVNDPLLNLIQVPDLPKKDHYEILDFGTVEDITKRITDSVSNSKRKAGADDRSVKRLHKPLTLTEKPILDLEIVSVPENYPTHPHNVTSLGELYYLTQTLPLIKLLPAPNKALITSNYESALLEGKIAVLYSRIEELKRQLKWSLRQPSKHYDPFVYIRKTKKKPTHTAYLLEEAKWLAEDFKQTKRYKMSCAVMIAQAVLDFWEFGTEVCIKRKKIVHLEPEITSELINKDNDSEMEEIEIQKEENQEPSDFGIIEKPVLLDLDLNLDSEMTDVKEEASEHVKVDQNSSIVPLPQDILARQPIQPLAEGLTPIIELETTLLPQDQSVSTPLPPTEVVTDFVPPQEPTIDLKLLLAPPEEVPNVPAYSRPTVGHVSPFKMNINLDELKKVDQSIIKNLPSFTAFDDEDKILKADEITIAPISRLIHPYDSDDSWYKIIVKDAESSKNKKAIGPPEFQKGLFGIQPHRKYNVLKPPKPPSIENIENRSPTIWLPNDDKILVHYIAEFCFNWDLISEHLSFYNSSLKRYESNIERRTPWQCFERYIQLNDKFQFVDMRGSYAYSAQQWLEKAHRTQLTTKRRISPLGVATDSIQRGHRKLRWASMFDAMRKSMKKREIAQSKLNLKRTTTADFATPSGSNSSSAPGTAGPVNSMTTNTDGGLNSPTQFGGPKRSAEPIATPSELAKLKYENDKSSRKAYHDQAATRNRMMQAVSQQKSQGPMAMNSRGQAAAAAGGNTQAGNSPTLEKAGMTPNSQLSKPGQTGQPDSTFNKLPTNPNGTPYTPEQLQQLMNSQKQRRLMQQQQQQKMSINSGPGNNLANSSSQNNRPNGSTAQASASKPRITFPPAQVSAIINSIQTKNPGLGKDQVTKLAATYLANLQQQQQNRMNGGVSTLQLPSRSSSPTFQQTQLQQLQQRGRKVPNQISQSSQQSNQHAQALTPQERNQLQMLKARTAQQQQMQQQQLQLQLQQQLIRQQQQQMLFINKGDTPEPNGSRMDQSPGSVSSPQDSGSPRN